MYYPRLFTAFLLLICYSSSLAQNFDGCITIDFETIPNTTPQEGLIISDQYFEEFGLTFTLENGVPPVLAQVGSPTTAFGSSFGNDTPVPFPDQGIGQFFLTDDGFLSGLSAVPLLLNFASPIDSFGGCILDMDFDELFIIEARGENGETLLKDTVFAGDIGTGDGISTCWGFNFEGCEGSVFSIRFEGQRQQSGAFGLGMDNFSFCTSGVDIANQIDIETQQVDCNNATSSIVINNLGTETYLYSIDGINFQESPIFQDIPPGVYTITVADPNNCLAEWTVEIEVYIEPTIIDVFVNDALCNESNGSIVIANTTSSTELQYSIDGINFGTSNSFDQLGSGVYLVSVMDEYGCIFSQLETISALDAPTIAFDAVVDDFCNTSEGSVILSSIGGTGQHTYAISTNPGVFQTNNEFSGLVPGTYVISVMDENGCIGINQFEIEPGITIAAELNPEFQNPNCFNSVGSITMVNSGTNTFQYSLDGINFQDSPVFEDLSPGVYNITVVDPNNCTEEWTVEIEVYIDPIIIEVAVGNAICNENNGSIVITNANSSTILEYSIDGINFEANNSFDQLGPGAYLVTVMDEYGCTFSQVEEVMAPNAPSVEVDVVVNDLCNSSEGSVTLSSTGGTGQHTYAISSNPGVFQSSNEFNGLTAGIYVAEVMDEDGCISINQFEVEPGIFILSEVVPDLIDPDCFTSTGTITMLNSGATTFQYSLDGINFQSNNVFTELEPDDYFVYIQDENNCIEEVAVMIPQFVPMMVSGVEVNHTSCGEDNGSFEITVSPDNGLMYALDDVNFQTSNVFDNLAPDTYQVTIMDIDSCIIYTEIVVDPSEAVVVDTVELTADICDDNNGAIVITANGGVGELTYAINDNIFQTDNTFALLDDGNYFLQIQDEVGCLVDKNVTIESTPPVFINDLQVRIPDCNERNGLITPIVFGGTGQIYYSIDGGLFQPRDSFPGLREGTYSIVVMDELGCQAQEFVTIPIPRCPIYIPNVFSPNADGTNDFFVISTNRLYDVQVLEYAIYDRWGEKVWEERNFTINTGHVGRNWWDGTFKSEDAMLGVYVYTITVQHLNGDTEVFAGDVTLLR